MTSGAMTFCHMSSVMKCGEVDGSVFRFMWIDHACRCVHQFAGAPTT